MIDIIHDNAYTDFIYANNYALGSINLGIISRTLMAAQSSDYMSTYDSLKPKAEAALEALYAKVE